MATAPKPEQTEPVDAEAGKLSDLIPPAPREYTFKGRAFRLLRLDFNDFVDLEEMGRSLESLEIDKWRDRRLLAWLVMRKGDPDLSPQERELLTYRLSLVEAGRLLDLSDETIPFVSACIEASGLLGGDPDPGEGEAARR